MYFDKILKFMAANKPMGKGTTPSNVVIRRKGLQLGPIHVIAAIVILLILYYVGSSVFFGNSTYSITGEQAVTVQINKSIFFTLANSSRVVVAFLANSTNSGATLYITDYPALSAPISALSMTSGSSFNVSSNAGKIADMHITLASSSPTQATFLLTPLLIGLGIRPSGGITVINPASLASGRLAIITTTVTTAVTTAGSSTTTVGSTTTINNVTVAQIAMPLVNATPLGSLMSKYKAIYIRDRACTPGLYNQTYISQFGTVPPAPNSFVNISQVTPTDLTFSVVRINPNTYNVTYSTVSSSQDTNGPALVLEYSTLSSSVVAQKFEGLYQGRNYTVLNQTYNFYNSINNNCGVFIP